MALPPILWECNGDEPEAVFHWFWKIDSDTPNLQTTQGPLGLSGLRKVNPNLPVSGWLMVPAVIRTKSQGRVHLTGPDPLDPPDIDANLLANPDDVKASAAAVELCREIGNSAALRPFLKQEIFPGNIESSARETFLRDNAMSWWHQSGTAKMGQDRLSVVDSKLKVFGIKNLRIADASIMPRVVSGNTMAPCVIIGEHAARACGAALRT